MCAHTLFFMARLNPFGSSILTFVPGGKIAAVTSVGRTSRRAVSVCSIIVVVQGQPSCWCLGRRSREIVTWLNRNSPCNHESCETEYDYCAREKHWI